MKVILIEDKDAKSLIDQLELTHLQGKHPFDST